jgi:hypothetical protein
VHPPKAEAGGARQGEGSGFLFWNASFSLSLSVNKLPAIPTECLFAAVLFFYVCHWEVRRVRRTSQ